MTAALPNIAMQSLVNREVEASLLGSILLDNTAFDRVSEQLRPEHFADELHRRVYVELSRQLMQGRSADVFTVDDALRGEVELNDRTLLAELSAMVQSVPSASHATRLAGLVVEGYQSRLLAAASSEIYDLAHDRKRSIAERIEAAQAHLSRLAEDAPRDEWVGAYDGMLQHAQLLEARAEGRVQSWQTGLSDLDELLEGGLRPGALVVLGARPAHGKTAAAMSIGLHMAATRSVALMSMEMPHRDVRDRMTAMLGRVPLSSVIRPNRADGLAWDKVLEGAELARTLSFYVSDQPGLNINQVRAKARNLKRVHGLEVLLVDYIGLMAGLDPKQNRAYQIEEITKGLKVLAKELGIVVFALSQLNRNIEQRTNRRPMLSDFRDSGSIEQDADIVLGLHREAADKPDATGEWQHYAELMVLKNRQGRTGVVNLHYEGQYTKFSGWAGPEPMRASSRSASRGFES